MKTERYTDMRSVSLTPRQGAALEMRARQEDRKPGSLIRVAVVTYLQQCGALPATEDPTEGPDEA